MAFTLDIPRILMYLRPGEAWHLSGDPKTYANLTWDDPVTSIPTEQDLLDAELAAAKSIRTTEIKEEAASRIITMWPEWRQRNASLGFYDGQDETSKSITAAVSATGLDTAQSVTDATNASPIVITITGHGYTTGDLVTIANVTGNTAANVTDNAITVLDANTFELDGTAGDGAYVSGGDCQKQIYVAPVTLTVTGHGYVDADLITVENAAGLTTINGASQTITVVDANTFTLNVAGDDVYTGSGTCKRPLSQGIKNNISQIRTDSDTAEAAVDALTTVQEVIDFTW